MLISMNFEEEVLKEEGLLGKHVPIIRFEYSPLGCELKKQTTLQKKKYQGLDKVYEFDETISKNDRK